MKTSRRTILSLVFVALVAVGLVGWILQRNESVPGADSLPAPFPSWAPWRVVLPESQVGEPTALDTFYATTMTTTEALQGEGAALPPFADRLVVFAADMKLVVEDVESSLSQVQSLADRYLGYVSASTIWPVGEDRLQARVMVRIPAENFTQALAAFKKLGVLRALNIASRDVTSEYIDLNARLTNYRNLEAQYRRFLNLTTNVQDALAVQGRIDVVREQIERLTGQIKQMENQINYASISLLLEQRPAKPPLEPSLEEAIRLASAVARAELRGILTLTVGLAPLWLWVLPAALVVQRVYLKRARQKA